MKLQTCNGRYALMKAHPLAFSIAKAIVLGVVFVLVFVADAHALRSTSKKHQGMQSVRAELVLASGWKFSLDETKSPSDIIKPEFNDANWQAVTIPHTWNAKDGQSIQNTYKRGVGYYRLKFEIPKNFAGSRFWIQFNAVSLVSDVWLNGQFLGEHKGGFGMFRYDVTDALRRNGANVLVVKADNTTQSPGTATEDVIPFSGDFNVLGGMYRDALLFSTDATLVDTLDQGSSGVFARSTDVSPARATVNVDARVRTFESGGRVAIAKVSLLDRKGRIVASRSSRVRIDAGPEPTHVEQALEIAEPHLWQGVVDPYLYRLTVELLSEEGELLDRVSVPYGIRSIRIDPNDGFFLNGKPYPLHGVAKHQDFIDKGWATTRADQELDMSLIREIGANTIRLSHYQHGQDIVDLADRYGLIVYAEIPLVDTPVNNADTDTVPDGVARNAKQQLEELIKQNFNHPSVAFWGIANEIGFVTRYTPKAEKAVDGLLETLRQHARSLDPSRPTIQADVLGRPSFSARDDTAALNRYYGWYDPDMDKLVKEFAAVRQQRPNQPIGLSEYGFGASIAQHTDNPRAIVPENLITLGRKANPDFMPEEYQSYGHEEIWKRIKNERYIFGTWVWNMFDFSAIGRKEGDYMTQGLSLNNKGLVTFDRQTKKDAFYFYKAQWNKEPMVYITGRRHVDRSYPVIDVKVYSNARPDHLSLDVSGRNLGGPSACDQNVCVWKEARLKPGENRLTVTAAFAGRKLTDTVNWTLADHSGSVRINVGSIAPMIGWNGTRYGSDAFLTEDSYSSSVATGNKKQLSLEEAVQIASSLPKFTPVRKNAFSFEEPVPRDPILFMTYREGRFGYDIPMPNGIYTITLSFFEPDTKAIAGSRTFDILVDGRAVVGAFDIFTEAGNAAMKAVVKEIPATVTSGRISIDFQPLKGKAILSAISITK